MTLRLNTDLAAGVFGLLFAALLWFPRESMGRLSIIFPRAILVITVVISLALIVKAFTKPAARRVHVEGNPVRLAVMIVVLFVWWYAIGLLGFLLATAIVFFGLTWYLARVEGPVTMRRLAQWVPVVALLIGAFYLAFTQVLNVRLPSGIWS
ncbi:tripartite tricarboxylate transporter TctB family protein [Modicisalibacter xianhensis]|uniref:Tripartite tricarboxylate transporter TctB family protein n=1 Tax=Modicisalibacter xianhensis TaxID=442341 RepID=A0A1I3FTB5_9GAMM|nr:tripartite tricarboxylate transporter TctB family protein [Halomonas xianhensis]SFI14425.1 Tripartite tricarboxylate transporter TctB family protein [Halomonas xianhensis]